MGDEVLAAALEDDDARQVAADALEEQGDPRGEYLRLELSLRRMLPLTPPQVWCVRLVSCDRPRYIQTIKAVRELDLFGLKEAKELVDSSFVNQRPIVSHGLSRSDAEADRLWLQRVPGTVTLVECESAAPVSAFDATWNRLAALSATLDPTWLRSINRMRSVVCGDRLDEETYAHVEALTWKVRPSAKGLLFGEAWGFPSQGREFTVRDGLLPETAERLVQQLKARTSRPFFVAPSHCFFAFPAGC